jgi:hypothetical protein
MGMDMGSSPRDIARWNLPNPNGAWIRRVGNLAKTT